MNQERQDEIMLSPISWRQAEMMIDPPQTPDFLFLEHQLTWDLLPLPFQPFQPFSDSSPSPPHHKTHLPTPEAQILYPRDDRQCKTRFTTMLSVYSHSEDLGEMIRDCWYTKEDLVGFKSERKVIVRRLKRYDWDASKIDTTKNELRGLEAYASIEFNTFMQNKRKEVIHGVLKEQNRQRSFGTFDQDRISAVSCDASAWARSRAHELGNNDALVVGCAPSFQSVDESSDSLPALSRLSYSSESSSSGKSMDFSWAEKLMGEELIPET